MTIRTSFATLCLIALGTLPRFAAAQPDDARLETLPAAEALPAIAQRLLDAVPADSAVWKRYLSERALYVDEAGDVAAKPDLLAEFRPFPPGLSGSIRVENPRITDLGDVATIVFEARERQTVYDQHIEVGYRTSQTWRREEGRWRVVLWHNMVVAKDPPALPIAAGRLKDYAGIYDLSGKRRYVVMLRGDSLLGGPEGRDPTPLIAVGDNVFAEAGSSLGVLRIFVRDANGAVARMVQRRKFADVVWVRVPTKPTGNRP